MSSDESSLTANPGSPPKLPPKPAFSLTWLTSKVSGILRRNSQTQLETKKSDEQSDEQHLFVPTEGRRESGAGDTNPQMAAAEVVPDSLPNAKRLHNSLDKYWIFRVIEDKTGIPKLYTAFFFSLCMAILGVYLMGIRKTSNTIAFVYPAYMSYRTLEMDSYEEHAYWLTYWLVYGVVDIMDGFFDNVLFWLPYYELLKFMFLFWLCLPKFRGCATIYSYIIRPVLVQNEEGIDSSLTAAGDKLGKATGELRNMSGELIATVLALFIKTLAMGVHKVGDAAVGGNNGPVAATPTASASAGSGSVQRRPSQIVDPSKKLS